jgi:hypothetical protein
MDIFRQDWSSPAIDPMQGVANAQSVEWHRLQLRGMANAINPISHPYWFSPAQIAKARLRWATITDRRTCADGRWVEVSPGGFYETWEGHNLVGYELKKPRYRWERRR